MIAPCIDNKKGSFLTAFFRIRFSIIYVEAEFYFLHSDDTTPAHDR